MRLFDLIFVREGASFKELAEYDLSSVVVPDLSFYTPFDGSNKRNTDKVGITDSVFVEMSRRLLEYSVKNNMKFLPALTNVKLRVGSLSSWLPWVRYCLLKKSRWILRKSGMKLRYEHDRQHYYSGSYSDYVNSISSVKFLVVARFHSLCFSLKTMTPFYAIASNSHKMESMLFDVGIGKSRVKEVNEILALSQSQYLPFNEEEKKLILRYVEDAPQKIEEMFVEIKKLIE